MAQPRYGSGLSPGPRVRNTSWAVHSPQIVGCKNASRVSIKPRGLAGFGESRAAIPPSFAAPSRGAEAKGRLAPGRAVPVADLPLPSPLKPFPRPQPGLRCKCFSAFHPLQESPRGGTWGGYRRELSPEHPRAIPTLLRMAGREGVTWPRSVAEKMGKLPGPQALSPCPCFCPLPCQGKITRKEQSTTGLTYAGQNHANAGQSSIFQINTILSEPLSTKQASPLSLRHPDSKSPELFSKAKQE